MYFKTWHCTQDWGTELPVFVTPVAQEFPTLIAPSLIEDKVRKDTLDVCKLQFPANANIQVSFQQFFDNHTAALETFPTETDPADFEWIKDLESYQPSGLDNLVLQSLTDGSEIRHNVSSSAKPVKKAHFTEGKLFVLC